MPTFDRKALLALPVRQPNEMRAKTVGEYLLTINKYLMNNIDQVINYMFVDTPITWKDEVGYAFVDAGLVELDEDYTIPIPKEEANQEIITFLMESSFGAADSERVFSTPATSIDVLNTPMDPDENYTKATTVGEFLADVATVMWNNRYAERLFGNSDWAQAVEAALIKAGYVEGTFDEDGYIESSDGETTDTLVLKALHELPTLIPAKEATK